MPVSNHTDAKTANATELLQGLQGNGDKFPPDLEFIDDADVVTLPDGTTKLVTDKPKTANAGPNIVSSQVSRDTSKLTPDSNPALSVEAKNATENSTAEAIKMLRRRQAPVQTPVIQQFILQSPLMLRPLPAIQSLRVIPADPFRVLIF